MRWRARLRRSFFEEGRLYSCGRKNDTARCRKLFSLRGGLSFPDKWIAGLVQDPSLALLAGDFAMHEENEVLDERRRSTEIIHGQTAVATVSQSSEKSFSSCAPKNFYVFRGQEER